MILGVSSVFAMGATPDGASPLIQIIPFVLILGIFYFIILLPAKRKQQKVQAFLDSLKVNDKVITTRDMALTLRDLKAAAAELGKPWEPLSAEERPDAYDLHDVLDELVMAELRAQDATDRGLTRKTDVQARFWYRVRNFLSQEWVSSQLEQVAQDVTEEQVQQSYQENPWLFREPEMVRLREMVVDAEEPAKAALVKLLEGVGFPLIAQQVSLHSELAQGESVDQWVMRGTAKATFAPNEPRIRTLDPVLEQAAFAIDKADGISSYVKGADNHYHIFQLVERKAERQKPLTEVADSIRNFLQLQRLSKNSEALRTKAKVETFPERLTTVENP